MQRVFLGKKGSTGVQFDNMPFSILVKGPTPGDQMYHEENLAAGPNYKSRAHQLLKNCMFLMFSVSDAFPKNSACKVVAPTSRNLLISLAQVGVQKLFCVLYEHTPFVS